MADTDTGRRSAAVLLVGMLVLAGLVGVVLLLLAAGDADATGALVIGPILFGVSLPVFARRARLEGDRRLFWFLAVALLLKLIAAFVRYFVAFDVYGGVADANVYSQEGARIADGFRQGNFDTGLETLSSTDFIKFFTGVTYTIFGTTTLGGFLVYSWLGFWGLYGFYRAYTIAVPEGRRGSYAKLLFFLPSLLFWPSAIGKEAWMMFALGVAAVGVAWIMHGRLPRGLAVAGIGLWLGGIVRPHVAGLLGVAMVTGYLFRRSRTTVPLYAAVGKVVTLAALLVVAVVLVQRADAFLEEKNYELELGVTSVLERTAERTGERGGSTFGPSVLDSPARVPIAVATVLFRPFIFEAHNVQSLAAAAEMSFLLLFALARWRWVIAAFRSFRRQAYVAFSAVYVGLFILAFSGVANFGILARERVQMIPLLLVLLTIPPRRRVVEEPDGRRVVYEALPTR